MQSWLLYFLITPVDSDIGSHSSIQVGNHFLKTFSPAMYHFLSPVTDKRLVLLTRDFVQTSDGGPGLLNPAEHFVLRDTQLTGHDLR